MHHCWHNAAAPVSWPSARSNLTRRPLGRPAAQTREAAWAEAQRQLDEVRDAPSMRGRSIQTQLELGRPEHVILRLAREHRVSLIVMTTRRRAGASRLSLGSVAGHVLRQTHIPVLLLTPSALTLGSTERLLQPVLVPLDGSELSARILPVARGLASCLHIPVTLVQALEPESFAGFPARAVAPFGTELERASLKAASTRVRAKFEEIARRWRQDGIATTVEVGVGAPATVMDDIAAKTGRGGSPWRARDAAG